jgi:hypothetical protein
MKLLRHSDIKLTAKVYTDESQLPIYDAIKGLPRLSDSTQIRAQISGVKGRNVAQTVAKEKGKKVDDSRGKDAVWRELSLPVLAPETAEPEGLRRLRRRCRYLGFAIE